MENVLLIITNRHQGRKENALLIREERSILQKKPTEKWFAHQIFIVSYQCCFWLLCCAFEHRCDTWYSCQTQSANCLCLSGTPSYAFIAVLYFTVGGEIWLSTQGPLCLLGLLLVWIINTTEINWMQIYNIFEKCVKPPQFWFNAFLKKHMVLVICQLKAKLWKCFEWYSTNR